MRWIMGSVAGVLILTFLTPVVTVLTVMGTIGYMHLSMDNVPPDEKAGRVAGYLERVMNDFWFIGFPTWGFSALLAGWFFIRVTHTENGFAVVAMSILMGGYAGMFYWGWPDSIGPFLVVSVLFFIGAYIADQRRQKVPKAPASGTGDDTAKTD